MRHFSESLEAPRRRGHWEGPACGASSNLPARMSKMRIGNIVRRVREAGVARLFSLAWSWFWVLLAGRILPARLGMRIASWWAPPYMRRRRLALWNPRGFISPSAVLDHRKLRLGSHVFLDDRVLIFQDTDGGPVTLGDRVSLMRDVIIETGEGGSVTIGEGTRIGLGCQLMGYKGSIRIGSLAHIAPNCAFYPYNHGIEPGKLILEQPLQTRGSIVVEEDAWLSWGVIVLEGVRVGRGAVVGAGAVVTRDIPDNAIATGVPAQVVRMRDGSRPSGSGEKCETGGQEVV